MNRTVQAVLVSASLATGFAAGRASVPERPAFVVQPKTAEECRATCPADWSATLRADGECECRSKQ